MTTQFSETNCAITGEIYKAFEKRGAGPDFLCIIRSWGDTLDDADVLLVCANATCPTGKQAISSSNGCNLGLSTRWM